MKVGTALSILAQPGRPDVALFNEHMALGDLAEPLGFDSLFALEHHFTGYSMSPAPLQLLSYYAGRTKRITLGTCVIVLPWHDPDPGGRADRTAGRHQRRPHPDGLRPRRRQRRIRGISHPDGGGPPALRRSRRNLIIKALSQRSRSTGTGEFYKIPRMSIRPRPISHPGAAVLCVLGQPGVRRGHGEAGLRAVDRDAERMAEGRRGRASLPRDGQSVGHTPRPPIILTNVACAPTREEAREWALRYLSEKWDSIDNHYHFSDGHLAAVKGYESYGKLAKTYTKMKDASYRAKATDFYLSIQIVGTPDDCVQQIAELRRLTGMDHLVTEFSFGSMPHHLAELNMRLFAEQVMPVLQRDAAFQGDTDVDVEQNVSGGERLFAPA